MTADEQMIIFCRNIRYMRKLGGVSKKLMAKMLGISVYTLTRIEAEDYPPRLDMNVFYRLAALLDCPVSRLFRPIYE